MADTITEYSQGANVTLEINLAYEHSVESVKAVYKRVKEETAEGVRLDHSYAPIELYGDGGGYERATVVVSGWIESKHDAGEYACFTLSNRGRSNALLAEQSQGGPPIDAPRFRVV